MDGTGQRVDKWLFFTRLTKTRSLAQSIVQSGAVRVNREKIELPSKTVRPGDVLTLSLHGRVRVVRVRSAGARRGPPSEAALLYEDLSAPAAPAASEGTGAVVPAARPSPREMAEARRLKRGGD